MSRIQSASPWRVNSFTTTTQSSSWKIDHSSLTTSIITMMYYQASVDSEETSIACVTS